MINWYSNLVHHTRLSKTGYLYLFFYLKKNVIREHHTIVEACLLTAGETSIFLLQSYTEVPKHPCNCSYFRKLLYSC